MIILPPNFGHSPARSTVAHESATGSRAESATGSRAESGTDVESAAVIYARKLPRHGIGQRLNRSEPMPRSRPSLAPIESVIRASIGAGTGFPRLDVLTRDLGYYHQRNTRHALRELEKAGRIRRAGIGPHGRVLWELCACANLAA